MNNKWQVHKFGGTSVLNAERYKNVSEILTQLMPKSKKAIVVSAMKGVTDDLIEAVQFSRKNRNFHNLLKIIQMRHEKV